MWSHVGFTFWLPITWENVLDLIGRLRVAHSWSTLLGLRPPSYPGIYRSRPRPTRANSPSVCSSLQPQAQGSRGRRRLGRRADPARTLRTPKGRMHGRGTGCSSGRSGGGEAAARRPATAEPKARGTQRSRGSIAEKAADTCGWGQQGPKRPLTERTAGSPAPSREPLPYRQFASQRHRGQNLALCWLPAAQSPEGLKSSNWTF